MLFVSSKRFLGYRKNPSRGDIQLIITLLVIQDCRHASSETVYARILKVAGGSNLKNFIDLTRIDAVRVWLALVRRRTTGLSRGVFLLKFAGLDRRN